MTAVLVLASGMSFEEKGSSPVPAFVIIALAVIALVVFLILRRSRR